MPLPPVPLPPIPSPDEPEPSFGFSPRGRRDEKQAKKMNYAPVTAVRLAAAKASMKRPGALDDMGDKKDKKDKKKRKKSGSSGSTDSTGIPDEEDLFGPGSPREDDKHGGGSQPGNYIINYCYHIV